MKGSGPCSTSCLFSPTSQECVSVLTCMTLTSRNYQMFQMAAHLAR